MGFLQCDHARKDIRYQEPSITKSTSVWTGFEASYNVSCITMVRGRIKEIRATLQILSLIARGETVDLEKLFLVNSK